MCTIQKITLLSSVVFSLVTGATSDRPQLFNLSAQLGTAVRFPLTDRVWPANPGEASVCMWGDDKLAAVSITIDDNITGEFPAWTSWGTEYYMRFTWFVVTNWVTSWQPYIALKNAGHDIQSHSVSHADVSGLTDGEVTAEYASAVKSINQNIPGNKCLTLGYPFGILNRAIASKTYIAARDVGKGYPTINNINRVNHIDYIQTFAFDSEGDSNTIAMLLKPKQMLFRGWSCHFFHGIASIKPRVITFLSALKAHQNDLWVAPYTEVALYGQERDTKLLTVTENKESLIRFTLSDSMADSIYTYPLTVKVCIPDSWGEVKALQNGLPTDVSVVSHLSKKYALVKSIPDKGDVTLTPATTTIRTSDSKKISQKATCSAKGFDLNGKTLESFGKNRRPINFYPNVKGK